MTGNTNGNRIEHGRYVDFERLETGGIKVTLNDDGRAFLAEEAANQREQMPPDEAAYHEVEWPDFGDLIEDFLCNGWDWVSAEECGALTGNPYMITDWKSVDDHGTIEYIGNIYYYEPYAVYDPVEMLYRNGHITLWVAKADEAEDPTVTCEFPVSGGDCGRRVYKTVAKQGYSGRWFCLEHARAMGVA